jgi:hypothetical protein
MPLFLSSPSHFVFLFPGGGGWCCLLLVLCVVQIVVVQFCFVE